MSFALSNSGLEYDFVRDEYGNVINSETRSRTTAAEWPYGGTYRLVNAYSGEALGVTATAVGTEEFHPDAVSQSWVIERIGDD